MAVAFAPDIVSSIWDNGFGLWLSAHYFEHQRFVNILVANNPLVKLTDYNLNVWKHDEESVKDWIEAHAIIHEELRGLTGVGGVDLSQVDMDNNEQFMVWLDYHRQEHMQLRNALGAT